MRVRGLFLLGMALLAYSVWSAGVVPEARLVVPQSDLLFSHRLHVVDQEIECTACHVDVESSRLANDGNLPTMDECAACHDVEDDDLCGRCHRRPDEPMGLTNPDRPIEFNHQKHLAAGTLCERCHDGVGTSDRSSGEHMPKMAVCLECHDGSAAADDCALCHAERITLADIHPVDWRHSHADEAALEDRWCVGCHREETACMQCHRGDNLTGDIHDLNYFFTHGLDAESRRAECGRCHETRRFCNDCHQRELRMPLRPSTISWRSDHGRAAREDVENCAACHDSDDPTCARSGCHTDRDGVRGTDAAIHDPGAGRFDSHGPWHDDEGFFCYQCHVRTSVRGVGFCGYCHD